MQRCPRERALKGPDSWHNNIGIFGEANIVVRVGKAHATNELPRGYWTGDAVLKQLKVAVTIFELQHPGCIGLFLFDNSTGHGKLASNALVANHLNKNPGGQVPTVMRSTFFIGAEGWP